MYSEYRKLFSAKQYNEKEFCDFTFYIWNYVKRRWYAYKHGDDISKSHLYTIKIHVLNHKEIYRTIKIPSIYFVSDLVHCALATFDLLTLEPYIAEFNDAKFYCNHLFEKFEENELEDALINVRDVKTDETIPIVDKNLSYGLEHFNGQIYICGRIINYYKVNFMSNAIVLVGDKEVKQLVRDIKNNNFTSIDYFQRALIIQNKQQN